MFSFFSRAAVSSETADWIAECFSWAMQNFDVTRFREGTDLVLPNDKFFPKKVESPEAMAAYILERVSVFAGVADWPWRLVRPESFKLQAPPLLGLNPSVRVDSDNNAYAVVDNFGQDLQVTFLREQTAKPQDLTASFAQAVAQHMLWQSQLTPPGGPEYFMQTAEVLAIFMGFGVMVTNSAYTFRGSCARCYNPRANRQASLSESECVYALALFADLKGVARDDILPYLKKYLRTAYKSAEKQLDKHPGAPHLRELMR